MRLVVEPVLSGANTVLAGVVDVGAVRHSHDDATSQTEGYDFQHPAVLRNVPPPPVRFGRPLRWWSLDRRRRLVSIMRLRDHLVEDILCKGVSREDRADTLPWRNREHARAEETQQCKNSSQR